MTGHARNPFTGKGSMFDSLCLLRRLGTIQRWGRHHVFHGEKFAGFISIIDMELSLAHGP
jgi:hypothetical protein